MGTGPTGSLAWAVIDGVTEAAEIDNTTTMSANRMLMFLGRGL
jgi:hypothetical protein